MNGRAWPFYAQIACGAVFLALMARAAAWGLSVSWGWKSYNDSAIFNYIAWRMGEGMVPYRDLFDMNFPGIYVVHWLMQAVLGRSDFA
ncbi:MAG: hypothetical protein K2Q01_02215, partial [Rickettsiales bacterium]|nr:hypothetical protein [Rickettsiales bacterium]